MTNWMSGRVRDARYWILATVEWRDFWRSGERSVSFGSESLSRSAADVVVADHGLDVSGHGDLHRPLFAVEQ